MIKASSAECGNIPKVMPGELESLIRIRYTGKYKDIHFKVTKSRRKILEAFAIEPNTL